MKPPKRKRVVSETFEGMVCGARSGETFLGVSFPRLTDKRFKPKDRVRVKVTKLERGK